LGEVFLGYAGVLTTGVGAGLLVAVGLFLGGVLAPRLASATKSIIFECGILPEGEGWSQTNIRFYIFAILFVIFDVEVVFLVPWAVVFRAMGEPAFWEMMIFIAVLMFGLVYAWRRGALQWK
jgi:NAD(P)H-quinone oxidoreductase subunit 3